LKTYGYIQAFGRGIAVAKREMEKNGNPPVEFQVTQSAVLCILRKKA
jgi:ATP-dependent DNA helicase RecG